MKCDYSNKIPFAYNSEGKMVFVDQAISGILCGCICPICRMPLIARNNGKTRVHHFAHSSISNCTGNAETIIHHFAKELLSNNNQITLPSVSYIGLQIARERVFNYEKIMLEKMLNGIIPDAILESNTGEKILIEIKVTHPVSEEKRLKIREIGLGCLEISLDFLLNFDQNDDVEETIKKNLFQNQQAEWIFTNELEHFRKREIRNKYLKNGLFFDSSSNIEVYFNEQLKTRNSLEILWDLNEFNPFIAKGWINGNNEYVYIFEDPLLQSRNSGLVFGYECILDIKVKNIQQVTGFVVTKSRKHISSPFEKCWDYVQDNPDELITEKELENRIAQKAKIEVGIKRRIKKRQEKIQIEKQRNEETLKQQLINMGFKDGLYRKRETIEEIVNSFGVDVKLLIKNFETDEKFLIEYGVIPDSISQKDAQNTIWCFLRIDRK